MNKQLIKFLGVCIMLLFAVVAHAQSRSITGTVVDEKSQPVIGAVVKEMGTKNGAITSPTGTFSITTTTADPVLEVSYVGFTTKKVTVGAANEVSVVLAADETLEEVVVTALAIKKATKTLGYSTESVDGDEITRSGEQNVIQGLASKTAGIQVIGSGGTPGASSKMLIRGNSTFTGNNQPLVVVDGVPIDNSQGNANSSGASDYPFNAGLGGTNSSNRAVDVNPEDIESITVLKGPSAAALYGARAGAGAIIITTKKGRKNSGVSILIGSSVERSSVNKLPEIQSKYAGGGSPASGPSDNPADYTAGGTAYSWGPTLASLGLSPVDNTGNFFQTGTSFNNTISVSGGNETSDVRLSIGRTDQNGVVPNSSWDRTSVRLTANTDVTDKLTVGGTMNYVTSGGTRVQNGSNLAGMMLTLMRAPRDFDFLSGSGSEKYLDENGEPLNAFFPYDNPHYSANVNTNKDKVDRVLGNVNATYKFNDNIDVAMRLGTDVYSDRRVQRFGYYSWESNPGYEGGQMEEFVRNSKEVYNDVFVNMKKDLNSLISGRLTVGGNLWHSQSKDIYSRGEQMDIPDFFSMTNFNTFYTGNSETTVRTSALFLDGGVDYKDAIFLNFTGRNEWSSTFGASKNNYFFPAVNTSIVFTEFLDVKHLNFGKVRAGYAESGISPGAYATTNVYGRSTFTDGFTNGLGFPYMGANGFSQSSGIGNVDIRPERQKGLEFGVDLRFLDGKINFDATYYSQKSVDILLFRPIAASTGYGSIFSNAGEMINKGWELSLNLNPIRTKDFSWIIGTNWSKNVNEVLALADGVEEINIESAFSSIGSYAIIGDAYGALYGSRWKRDGSGNLVIDASTGLPLQDDTRGNIGNPFPDWLMNIRNSFSYKGFNLTGLLDIRKGGDIWAGTHARLTRHGVTAETEDRDEMMVIEGVLADADGNPTTQANTTEIPKWKYYTNVVGDYGASEQAVYDGSWVRLRELSLDYNFNLDKFKYFKTLNVYVTGRNLWLSTKYPGIDPETSLTGSGSNVTGFDYFNNPGTKSFIFGFKLGL